MKITQLGDEAAKAAEREGVKRLRRMVVPEKALHDRGLFVQMRSYSRKPFKSPVEALMLARGEVESEE